MNRLIHWLANTSLTTRVASLILGMMLLLALLTAQLQWVEYRAAQTLANMQQQAGQHLQQINQLYIDWLLIKNALDARPQTATPAPDSSALSWQTNPQLIQAQENFSTALHQAQAALAQTPALVTQLTELNSHVQGYLLLSNPNPSEANHAEWRQAGAVAISTLVQQLQTTLDTQTSAALNQAQTQLIVARERTWLLLLIALSLGLIWGWLIVRSIRSPLLRLFTHAQRMTEGDFTQNTPYTDSQNEIGQMARIIAQLQSSAQQMQADHWIKSQQAALLTLMQGATRFTELTRQILDFLCPLLGTAQGGFYIFDPRQQRLRLLGGYAFSERKAHHPYFHLGEGLVGQCALERAPLIIHEPPPGYFTVTSSLGQGAPGLLYLVPVATQQRILGVLELASFTPMSHTQWQLLDAVLPLISLSIEMLEQRGANAEAELTPLTARQETPRATH